MADPRDLKFFPSDMTLADHYLRRRIDTDKEGFIKDIKLYEDHPWLLPHVNNNLFNEKEFFYNVKRTLKARKTPNRKVLGRGGITIGTWKSNGSKEDIVDRNKVVIGHKTELSYYKHGDLTATGWCMTEYWLASKNIEFQETVLCYIRGKKKQVKNVSSYASSNRVSAPREDMITMVDPSHLKFFPTDLKLVEHYLCNRLITGKDGFITDIKLYEDEPWRLPHVKNDQFIDRGWFYFC
ncbi:PREDICTED: NAC domain-containing protein 6-like [Camelina sativa]|uniref:NAC domain-containing protein 6-like n=1 Tax=Camelina sativa TaxID=90675 RepID=A0ABM0VXH7_CAMSA|nr:PREDICTED: NAC domain-containing protein 6-like [Camelina sativa]